MKRTHKPQWPTKQGHILQRPNREGERNQSQQHGRTLALHSDLCKTFDLACCIIFLCASCPSRPGNTTATETKGN